MIFLLECLAHMKFIMKSERLRDLPQPELRLHLKLRGDHFQLLIFLIRVKRHSDPGVHRVVQRLCADVEHIRHFLCRIAAVRRSRDDLNRLRRDVVPLHRLAQLFAMQLQQQQIEQRGHSLLPERRVDPERPDDLLKIHLYPRRSAHMQKRRQLHRRRIFSAVLRKAGHVDAERPRLRAARLARIVVPSGGEQQHVVPFQRVFPFPFRDAPAAVDQIERLLRHPKVAQDLNEKEEEKASL